MEFTWSSSIATAFIFFLSIYFLLKFAAARIRKSNPNSPPEAAGGWPLIGHLNLLSGPEQPHVALSDLADKYGPIYSINLGVHRCLVVSSWEVAKEIFNSTNDVCFSNRPQTVAIQLMSYDFAMFGFSKYNDYWRELRKFCMQKLLSAQRVSTLGTAWETETRAMMKSIYISCRKNNFRAPLEMKKCLGDLTLNSMVRIVSGATVKKMDFMEAENWREQIREFFKMMDALTFTDVVPYLKWLDHFKGTKKDFEKTGKMMDTILQSWLEKHKKLQKNKSENGLQQLDGEKDFMEVMMEAADSFAHQFPKYDADTIIKATCQTMIIAGTDTMTVTLVWALCLLLNNRHVLERAQQELDNHIGRSRMVEKSDIGNLVYIQAIIKETLRLYPAVLLLPPREASRDSTIAGYQIPAGTRVILNLWKVQRDPCVWSDPLEFKPERFLTEHRDVDLKGQHFQFLPFGVGRRICPGITFALQFMELALATLLHGFDLRTPEGDVVDMTGSLGTTNMKASPLPVLLTPRLSHDLFLC
ncbi:cytochrome P450 CYP82D47-like [Primulina huaijiensis]|uniref:cytochrome P450 CYP82D47-like n=1 Tax=Primulina huaijiensis TaxID=1492673 RepID=UPI003CC73D7B